MGIIKPGRVMMKATSKSCDRRSALTPQPPLPERERGLSGDRNFDVALV